MQLSVSFIITPEENEGFRVRLYLQITIISRKNRLFSKHVILLLKIIIIMIVINTLQMYFPIMIISALQN